MAPASTTHNPVKLGETLELIIGPSPGGTYQNQAKDEHDTNELLNAEYPTETLFDNLVLLQIKDKDPLVWIPLPCLDTWRKTKCTTITHTARRWY